MFRVEHKFPTNNEFNELFCSVGWGKREDKKINNEKNKCEV